MKGFTIYGRGGYLDHVTQTTCINAHTNDLTSVGQIFDKKLRKLCLIGNDKRSKTFKDLNFTVL